MTKQKERHMQNTTSRDPIRRPIDVAEATDDTAWCSCGKRIWGMDRSEFAAAWYEHLTSMIVTDPEGDHALHRQ